MTTPQLASSAQPGCAGRMAPAVSPGLEEFTTLAGQYDLALVKAVAAADLETPVSSFIKLKGEGPCFLLESAEGGEKWGRYSLLGFDTVKMARAGGRNLVVTEGTVEREVPGDPVQGLFREVEADRLFSPDNGIPFPGGAVGYFGYDILPCLEKVALTGKSAGLPEMMFMFPREVAVFDHLRSRIHLGVVIPVPRKKEDCRAAHAAAAGKVSSMLERLRLPIPPGAGECLAEPGSEDFAEAVCNMTRERFEEKIMKARDYVHAGDAFQVVISQRFTVGFAGDPLSVYRFLRHENPSPYMFYMELPSLCLVGSSPEPLVTRREEAAVIRPIAGTRPRGSSEEEDLRMETELRQDEKEKAEHIMLVDLARNDLGRVCAPGTVRVGRMMEVERYSHVMHLVSEVSGRLREGMGNYELLKASFPAGTVSGAPKVRACEIIDELEEEMRGPYAGAIGYVSHTGDMDTCIAIRTVIITEGEARVQAGAGVVADSVPSLEWEETRNKARVLLRALSAAGEAAV